MIDHHHLERGERLRQLEQRAAPLRLRILRADGAWALQSAGGARPRWVYSLAALEQLIANVEATA